MKTASHEFTHMWNLNKQHKQICKTKQNSDSDTRIDQQLLEGREDGEGKKGEEKSRDTNFQLKLIMGISCRAL